MKAVTVRPGRELEALAGESLGWSYAARIVNPVSADALAWARAAFERAPVSMRAFLVVGWTLLLLEGRPRSDTAHILGWPVVHATPNTAVLKRQSRLGISATLVFSTSPDAVSFASGMAYRNSLGRVVWAGVAPLHRWTVRRVLTQASAEVGRS